MPVAGHDVIGLDGGVGVVAVGPAGELVAVLLGGDALGEQAEGLVGLVLDGLEEGAVLGVEGHGVGGDGGVLLDVGRVDVPVAGDLEIGVDGGAVVVAVGPAGELVALRRLGDEREGTELDVRPILDGLEEGAVLAVEGHGVGGDGIFIHELIVYGQI